MNCRHRSSVTKKCVLIFAFKFLVALATVTTAATAAEQPSGAIYTAADFPRLAQGVDPGFSGEAFASVWAPAGETWRQSTKNGTITLSVEAHPADPTPHWQSLGKLELVKHRLFKVKAPASVPALLWISSSQDSTAPSSFDLVRGRADSTEPSHDLPP